MQSKKMAVRKRISNKIVKFKLIERMPFEQRFDEVVGNGSH